MARLSKTGGKTRKAVRVASRIRGPKVAKGKRPAVPRKRRSISALQEQADRYVKELKDARDQQAATAEILKVINASGDLAAVFEIILEKTHSLCDVASGSLQLYEDGYVRTVATRGFNERWAEYLRQGYKIDDTTRPTLESVRPLHVADMRGNLDRNPNPTARIFVEVGGFRTFLGLPLLKDGKAIGRIVAARAEVRPFTDRQIGLLQGFADQAVLAIENARLFNEVQAKTRDLEESLQQQTATADVLKVISSTPGELAPVFRSMLENAVRLCEAKFAMLFLLDEDHFRAVETWNLPSAYGDFLVSHAIKVEAVNPLGRVAATKKPVHVFDILEDRSYIEQQPGIVAVARLGGARTLLQVPMLKDDELIGSIGIYRQEIGPFTDKQVSLVQNFAAQAVIAIENARLINETKEALERQTATSEVLKVIASSPSDVQPVFAAIATSANKLIGGFSTAVMRLIGDDLHLAAFTPTSPEADAALQAAFPGSISRFPQFLPALDGQTAQFTDTEADDVPPANRHLAKLRGYRSMLFTPLMSSGVPIGLISVTRKETGSFADHHVQLVRTFADQAVIAIENARLFDEVQGKTRDLENSLQQQTATADVLKVISRSAFDLDTVLTALTQSAARLCNASWGTVFLREGDVLRVKAHSGMTAEFYEFLRANPIAASPRTLTGRTMLTGEVTHIPDVLADPEYDFGIGPQVGHFRAALGVPLLREGRVEGVFALSRPEPGAFSNREIDLVRTFADQAVIAIANVSLFEDVEAKTRELSESLKQQTATSEVLEVISASPGELNPVFQKMLENACRVCEANFGVMQLWDGESFKSPAAYNVPPELAVLRLNKPIRPDPRSGLYAAMKTHQVVHRDDLRESEGYLAGVANVVEMANVGGARTLVIVPMLKDDQFIGVITIYRQEVRPFTDKQIALVQNFTKQAVIAIENTRLLEELQEKTRELTESLTYQTGSANILSVIASSPTDVMPVLKAIVESACEVCDAYDAVVALKEGDYLKFSAHQGPIPLSFERWPINRRWTAGRAFLDQKPVQVEDLSADENAEFSDGRELSLSMGHRTTLSVPLLREGESIGAIALRRNEVNPFSEKQIALLQTFADQAVIAIGNVRLFEQVQQRTGELSRSLDELRAAQDRLVQTEKLASLGQLTAGIAHEIKNPLNFVNNFSSLSTELIDEVTEALADAGLGQKKRAELDELTQMLKSNLEKVVQHGMRADSIVKNMLLHSREGSGEQRPVDINALVDEGLNLAYHGARAEKPGFNITLQRKLDPAAGQADVYPQEVTRVLLNIISNGFYAATRRASDAGNGFTPILSAETRNLGGRIEIRIRDNGTGMPADVKSKIFTPFFTTKPPGEGTGLGLSMSHDIIVKQHGGSIEVETEPGSFTEFIITLPRQATDKKKTGGQG